MGLLELRLRLDLGCGGTGLALGQRGQEIVELLAPALDELGALAERAARVPRVRVTVRVLGLGLGPGPVSGSGFGLGPGLELGLGIGLGLGLGSGSGLGLGLG